MKTDTRSVFDLWTRDAPHPEGDGVYNIGLSVQCLNPLWSVRTIGTADSASCAVIWPTGHNKPNIPAGLRSLSPSWIRFVRSILTLAAKDARRVVEPWTRDAPPPDGNVWVWRRLRARKGLLQSPILLGGGDSFMWYQPKRVVFGGQGLIIFQIGLWAV